MKVPYLKNKPKVVPIDLGRQPFADDFLIEKTTLKRTLHQAKEFEGNPVFKSEKKMEKNSRHSVHLGQGISSGLLLPTHRELQCVRLTPVSEWLGVRYTVRDYFAELRHVEGALQVSSAI